jgi:hypothetical protein
MPTHWVLARFQRFIFLKIAGMVLASSIASSTVAQVPQAWSWSADHPEASFQNGNASTERLFQVLKQRDAIDMKQMPLKRAMQHLSEQFGIQILIDAKGLEEETVSVEDPVDISLSDIPLGNALHWILSPLNLTYSIQSEVLLITSFKYSSECLVIYDVTSITVGQESTNARRRALDLDGIMRLIGSSISVDQWQNAGGTSMIEGFRDRVGRRCLAVRAPLETHQMIEAFFTVLCRNHSSVRTIGDSDRLTRGLPVSKSGVRTSNLRRAMP